MHSLVAVRDGEDPVLVSVDKNVVRVWDLTSRQVRTEFGRGRFREVTAVAAPGGRLLVAASTAWPDRRGRPRLGILGRSGALPGSQLPRTAHRCSRPAPGTAASVSGTPASAHCWGPGPAAVSGRATGSTASRTRTPSPPRTLSRGPTAGCCWPPAPHRGQSGYGTGAGVRQDPGHVLVGVGPGSPGERRRRGGPDRPFGQAGRAGSPCSRRGARRRPADARRAAASPQGTRPAPESPTSSDPHGPRGRSLPTFHPVMRI